MDLLDVKTFCKELPKCEFNARWDACISRPMLQMLEQHRREDGEKEFDLQKRKLLWSYGRSNDLDEAFHSLQLVYELVRRKDEVIMVTRDIIDRFHADNVVYLELRVGTTSEDFLVAMIEAIKDARKIYPYMVVKTVVTIMLHQKPETVKEVLNLVTELGKIRAVEDDPESRIIRGVEVTGLPEDDVFHFQDILDKVRHDTDRIVIYNLALETELIKFDDILRSGPDRLTCVYILFENQQDISVRHFFVSRLQQLRIPVDFCYTAGQMSLSRFKSLCPFGQSCYRHLLLAGHPVFISTGFGELLGCTLSDEYYRVALALNLTPQQIYRISRLASFYTQRKPRFGPREYFPFTEQYDEFAHRYNLNNSFEWSLRVLPQCFALVDRPLNPLQNRPRRSIAKLLYS